MKTPLRVCLIFVAVAAAAHCDVAVADRVADTLESFIETGDATAAAEVLGRTGDPRGLYGLFLARRINGRFDAAADAVARLIERFPGSPLAAAATVEVTDLRLRTRNVHEFLERLSAAFAKLPPGNFETRLLLGSALGSALVHYGDAGSLKQLAGFGRLQQGWVVGPFGVTGATGFLERFAPEDGMSPSSEFPDARVFGKPHLTKAASGALSTPRDAGVYYILVPVRCRSRAEVVLAVTCRAGIAFFVDGVNVASRHDRRGRFYLAISLPEGLHALVVKIPQGTVKIEYVVSAGRVEFGVEESYQALAEQQDETAVDAGRAVGAARAFRSVSSSVSARVVPAPSEAALTDQPNLAGCSNMAAVAKFRLRLAHGDLFGAKEELHKLLTQVPESPVAALLEAQVFLADNTVDTATAWSVARGALDRALIGAPEMAEALRLRSNVLARQDDPLGALKDLDACRKLAPEEFVWPLECYRLLAGRGLKAQARGALEEAVKLRGDNCAPLHARWAFLLGRRDFHHLEQLAGQLDAGHGRFDLYRAELLILRQDFVGARGVLAEAARARADDAGVLAEFGGRMSRLAEVVAPGAALQGGEFDKLRKLLLKELDGDIPVGECLMKAARARMAGLDELAARFEDRALRHRRPSSSVEIGAFATGDEPAWKKLWIDPQSVARTADPASLEAEPAWQILDHELSLFRGRSHGVSVYHGAYLLNTKRALDKWGELGVPAGATLLFARTIEPDGTVILPDFSSSADRISMPALSSGCMVEFAWLSTFGGSRGTKGGYVHGRWFFETEDMPILLSRVDVVTPAEVHLEVETSAGAPEARRSTLDDMELVSWQTGPLPRVRHETRTPPAAERLKCMRFATGTDWQAVADSYRGALSNVRTSFDDSLRFAKVVAGSTTPMEAAVQLFYKLHKPLELEHWPDTAIESRSLAPPRGVTKRGALLVRALEIVGIRVEPVLTRRTVTKPMDQATPARQEVARVFFRCEPPRGAVFWLDPTSDYAPFDYIPPAYRGAMGLVASSDAHFVRLPRRGDQASTEYESITYTEATSSRLVGTARYVYAGWRAQGVRGALATATPETTERIFQNLLRPKPGQIKIDSSDAQPIEDPSRPLVADIQFTASGDYAGDEGRLEFQDLLAPVKLSEKYITGPERVFDLVIGSPIDIESDITVPLEGTLLEPSNRSERVEESFGSFRLSVVVGADSVHIYRRIHIPVQRIQPDRYDDFARFCRSIDRLESLKFVFEEEGKWRKLGSWIWQH